MTEYKIVQILYFIILTKIVASSPIIKASLKNNYLGPTEGYQHQLVGSRHSEQRLFILIPI